MLATLLLLVQLGADPVRLTLGASPVAPGAALPVRVDLAHDGHLLVLRATTDGRVAVVFSGFVTRGPRQLRAGVRQALTVDDGAGTGLVLAALARQPLPPARPLQIDARSDWDAPAVLTAVARELLGGVPFDAAFALYTVRAGSLRPPPVAAAATTATTAPPPVVITIVQEAAPAAPAAAPARADVALLVASVCDVGAGGCGPSGFRPRRAPREPPVKTSGICQAGVDCPPGVGAPAKTLPRK